MDYTLKELLLISEKIKDLHFYEREGLKTYKIGLQIILPHDGRMLILKQSNSENTKVFEERVKILENLELLNRKLDILMSVDHDNGHTLTYSLSYYIKWGTTRRPNLIVVN